MLSFWNKLLLSRKDTAFTPDGGGTLGTARKATGNLGEIPPSFHEVRTSLPSVGVAREKVYLTVKLKIA